MTEQQRQRVLAKIDAIQAQTQAEIELLKTQAAESRLRAQGYIVKKTDAARVREAALALQAKGYTVTPPRRWR